MKNVVKKRLPHGTIPFERISDAGVKCIVMQINENIVSIKRQLESVQDAVNELKRG